MLKKSLIPMMAIGMVLGAHAGNYDVEANPSKVFIGVQLSAAMVQGTHGTDLNYASTGLGYGFRVGADNDEWRTMVAIDKMNNGKVSYERGEILVNYMFLMPQMEEMGLRPFIGLNAGYANYEAEGGTNESGFTYGAQAGVVYDINDQWDIDLSYEYTISRAEAFDHVGNIGIGINYKY